MLILISFGVENIFIQINTVPSMTVRHLLVANVHVRRPH